MTPDRTRPSEPERLPGVGQRLDLVDDAGRPLTVIRREDGALELHHEGHPTYLPPTQARALGALASGHVATPPGLAELADGVLDGIEIERVAVPEGAWAAGLCIRDLALRQRAGVTVVAIQRGSAPIPVTDATQRVEVGDELVIVSTPEGRVALERYLSLGA